MKFKHFDAYIWLLAVLQSLVLQSLVSRVKAFVFVKWEVQTEEVWRYNPPHLLLDLPSSAPFIDVQLLHIPAPICMSTTCSSPSKESTKLNPKWTKNAWYWMWFDLFRSSSRSNLAGQKASHSHLYLFSIQPWTETQFLKINDHQSSCWPSFISSTAANFWPLLALGKQQFGTLTGAQRSCRIKASNFGPNTHYSNNAANTEIHCVLNTGQNSLEEVQQRWQTILYSVYMRFSFL